MVTLRSLAIMAMTVSVSNAQDMRAQQPGCDVSGKRIDCFMNSQQSCEAKGCCWSPVQVEGTPWCFKKNAAPSPSCTTSPPCSGHGTCNADKQCTCNSPFLTCGNVSAHDCNIDSSSDIDHCGACGTMCPPAGSAGVVSSKCVNAACQITCDAGFLLCYGKCVKTAKCSKPPLPNCETFHENQCDGNVIVTNSTFENHRWFTPLQGEDGYLDSYQDYGRLVAHAHVVYNAGRTSATVQLIALHKHDGVTFAYIFAGVKQASDSKTFDAATSEPVSLAVSASDGSHLALEPVDFVWNAGHVNRSSSGDFRSGQKGAIVELFGWPHAAIKQECAFLAEHGYLGAKMFPMQEQVCVSCSMSR